MDTNVSVYNAKGFLKKTQRGFWPWMCTFRKSPRASLINNNNSGKKTGRGAGKFSYRARDIQKVCKDAPKYSGYVYIL